MLNRDTNKITHKFRSALDERYPGFVKITTLYPDSWWLQIQYNTLVQIKLKNKNEIITSYSKRYRIEHGENYFCYGSPEKYDNPRWKSYFYKTDVNDIESVYIHDNSPEIEIYKGNKQHEYAAKNVKMMKDQLNDVIKQLAPNAKTIRSLRIEDFDKLYF